MIFFLFIATESGRPEMAALEALTLEDAVREAQALPYAGRTGYLFNGDVFVREITTANTLAQVPSLSAPPPRRPPTRRVELAPRPG